jgi:hypothetical protein
MGCGCGGGQRKAMRQGGYRPAIGPKSVRNRQMSAAVARKRAIQEELNKRKTTGQISKEAKLKKLRKKAIMRALGK